MFPFHRPLNRNVRINPDLSLGYLFPLSTYCYPLFLNDGPHRPDSSFVNWPLDSMVRNRVGERMDLKLEANLDDIERRNTEPGDNENKSIML